MSVPVDKLVAKVYYSNACTRYPKIVEEKFLDPNFHCSYGFELTWNPVKKVWEMQKNLLFFNVQNTLEAVFFRAKTNVPEILTGMIPPDIIKHDHHLCSLLANLLAKKPKPGKLLDITVYKVTGPGFKLSLRYDIIDISEA